MADVLERMYRDQYQENLPDNWVPLLEVYNYFTFDKLVANDKVIIYLVIFFFFFLLIIIIYLLRFFHNYLLV